MLDDTFYPERRCTNPTNKLISNIYQLLSEFGPLVKENLHMKLKNTDTNVVPDLNKLVQIACLHGLCAVTIDPKGISYLFGRLRCKTIIYSLSQEILLGFMIGSAMAHSRFYDSLQGGPMCTRVTRRLQDKLSKKTFAMVRLHYPGALDQLSPANKNLYGTTINLQNMLADSGIGFAKKITFTKRALKPIRDAVIDGIKINIKYGYGATLKYWKGVQNKYNNAISR